MEPIGITFIENSPIVFESINLDKPMCVKITVTKYQNYYIQSIILYLNVTYDSYLHGKIIISNNLLLLNYYNMYSIATIYIWKSHRKKSFSFYWIFQIVYP